MSGTERQQQKDSLSVLLISEDPARSKTVGMQLTDSVFGSFSMVWVGSIDEGRSLLETGETPIDLLLLDATIDGGGDGDAAELIRASAPDLPLVVIGQEGDEARALEAIKIGVQDYLFDDRHSAASLAPALRYAIERKKNEAGLRLARAVFDNTSEGILVTGPERRIIAVNRSFCRITGFSDSDLVGNSVDMLESGVDNASLRSDLRASLKAHGHWDGEAACAFKSGGLVYCWMSSSAIKDNNGKILYVVSVLRDITERKEAESQIWQQANYDSLTGLPNRVLFEDRLREAMVQAARSGKHTALMFVDLDRFKWVNDTLGHRAGDALLKEASKRLASCVRATDTVARQGGDEFIVSLVNLSQPRFVETVARKIIEELARPFNIEGQELFISGSIGIAVQPDDGETAESLMSNADTAMYRAKSSGRNTYLFFTQEMNEEALARINLERDLLSAIERGNFHLMYQPVVDLTRNSVATVEALLRWEDPERGLVAPSQFLPLAEETGLITKIGYWTLEEACRQIKLWRKEDEPTFRVAVNLSPRQFREVGFADHVLDILARTGVDGHSLSLEITEGLLLDGSPGVSRAVDKLRAAGVEISLDDFGTGFSSISHFRRLAVDMLKIDKSVIAGVGADSSDSVSLVETIVAMGHSMGATVIAEGVETKAQLEFLAAQGCDLVQGYLFGKPVRAGDLLQECKRSLKKARGVMPKSG